MMGSSSLTVLATLKVDAPHTASGLISSASGGQGGGLGFLLFILLDLSLVFKKFALVLVELSLPIRNMDRRCKGKRKTQVNIPKVYLLSHG